MKFNTAQKGSITEKMDIVGVIYAEECFNGPI